MTKRFLILAFITICALALPFVAMQFDTGVNWSLFDFIFAGTMIFGTGTAYLLVAKRSPTVTYRVAAGLALFATFILIWINGAVGIVGDSDVNVLYAGVLAVGFFSAIVARLKPLGMSWGLFAMAVAQMAVPVIALILKTPDFSPGVLQVFVLNGVFAMLFVGSGMLFRQAAEIR